ncbi:MAG: glutamate synthase central domain-containing protein, partial [Cyanobacteria bacterium J06648_11]
MRSGQVLKNWDVKQQMASRQPYRAWLNEHRVPMLPATFAPQVELSEAELVQMQTAFGFSHEDVEMIIEAMAQKGKEPIFSMGDDAPLAVLSSQPHPLYDYFKQRFAQVTNPAIDPLRESLVMSLDTFLGARGNVLEPEAKDARLLHLKSPVLNEAELETVQNSGFNVAKLSILWAIADGPAGLKAAISSLCAQAEAAVRDGAEVVLLSDRGLNADRAFIPPLLAVGAIHHHLIQAGLRLQTSIAVETAQCWSTHHFACLIGYGCDAICPYLAYETARQWWHKPKTRSQIEAGKIEAQSLEEVQLQYRAAVEAGLLKILSKMGISLVSSYRAAQIFEIIGLNSDVVDLAFRGTVSRVGGLTLSDLANEVLTFHQQAFPELQARKLFNYGFIQSRRKGEFHINSPEMSKLLHQAIKSGEPDHYDLYKRYIGDRPPTGLRDLLDFESDRSPISLDDVEPADKLYERFATGGMS